MKTQQFKYKGGKYSCKPDKKKYFNAKNGFTRLQGFVNDSGRPSNFLVGLMQPVFEEKKWVLKEEVKPAFPLRKEDTKEGQME